MTNRLHQEVDKSPEIQIQSWICVMKSMQRRTLHGHTFCETQWRHSMKTKLYNTPSPILHSVKRSDVTRWKQGFIWSPPPYFIVLASSVKTKEVKIMEFHRINIYICLNPTDTSVCQNNVSVFIHKQLYFGILQRIVQCYIKIIAITHLHKNDPISDNFSWFTFQNEIDFSSSV